MLLEAAEDLINVEHACFINPISEPQIQAKIRQFREVKLVDNLEPQSIYLYLLSTSFPVFSEFDVEHIKIEAEFQAFSTTQAHYWPSNQSKGVSLR